MRWLLMTVSSYCLRAWFVFCCFEGILRYGFEKVGAGWLTYLRDGLLIPVVIFALFDGAFLRHAFVAASIICLLFVGVSVGLMHSPLLQVAFGVRILIPGIVGLIVGCSTFQMPAFAKQAAFLCVISTAGVILTSVRTGLPWTTDATTEILGAKVANSREWTHRGIGGDLVVRSAGFSRASTSSAIQIMVLYLWVATRVDSRLTIILWLVASIGIAVTTSKGAVVAWLMVTTLMFVPWDSQGGRRIRQGALSFAMVLLVAAPCFAYFFDFSQFRARDGTMLGSLGFSFVERLTLCWPEAFELAFHDKEGGILGRGIGVGTPAKHFAPDEYNPGDNFFVFLILMFGILSVWIVSVCAVGLWWLDSEEMDVAASRDNYTLWTIGMSGLIYGITMNLLEDSMMAIWFAAAIGRGIAGHSKPIEQFEQFEHLEQLDQE